MSITAFTVKIPDAELEDLRSRIRATRWPSKESVIDKSQGVQLREAQRLAKYWSDEYSWRRCEALLNTYPQFKTTIFDVPIHFIHIKSRHASATPLLITHGWPGSVLEFKYIIPLLTDPMAHGGSEEDAFHLVLPSLPGYAFSGTPTADHPIWDIDRIAKAWTELMTRLGYDDLGWLAQGGDWGADVTIGLAHLAPPGLIGAHSNSTFFPVMDLIGPHGPKTAAEKKALEKDQIWTTKENGYFKQQSTRPQTVGYSLSDSPMGLLTWIYEKFSVWPEDGSKLSIDDKLDHITLYWLTNTGASSARMYFNCQDTVALETHIPVGFSVFPGDPQYATRKWIEKYHKKLVWWREVERGGHFAAWEVPDVLADEIRAFRRAVFECKWLGWSFE